MRYADLLEYCKAIIDSYQHVNYKFMTPDTHIDNFVKENPCSETQQVFFKKIFFDWQKNRKLLSIFVDKMLQNTNESAQDRKKKTLFCIIVNMIMFRLHQLPFEQFKKIIFTTDKQSIQLLFKFLFDMDFLKEHVIPLWCDQCYQLTYIQGKILPKISSAKERCALLLDEFDEQISKSKNKKSIKVSQTKTFFEEFNLTKPKPKRIPTPEKIDNQFKARQFSPNSLTLSQISLAKKQRREQFKQNKLKYYQRNKFAELNTDLRPSNLSRVRKEIEYNQSKDYYTIQPLPLPKFKETQVRTNIATILKQQKRIHDQIHEEQRQIKQLTFNLRDQTQYKKWQQELKMKEQYETLQNNQRRKIQIQLCKQRFAESCQKKIDEKKQIVHKMKFFQANLRKQRQQLQQKILNQNKKIIDDVYELRQNVQKEKKNIELKNRSLVLEKKDNFKRIMEKKKQEDQVEMEKKKQLIAEIRQLESFLKSRQIKKSLEVPSAGYMREMSIYQLKEKLKAVKQQRKRQQSQLRSQNIIRRQNYKEQIENKKSMILENRKQTNKLKEQQKQRKAELMESQRKRIQSAKEASMLEYKQRSLQKQKQKQLKEIQDKKKKKQMEMEHRFKRSEFDYEGRAYKSLQLGLQRAAINRHHSRLLNEYENSFEHSVLMEYVGGQAQRQAKSKVNFNQLYRQKLDKQILNGQQFENQHMNDKIAKYELIRSFRNKQMQSSKKSNPYKHNINEMHIRSAKQSYLTNSLSSMKKSKNLASS